jgi:hypothetical protein
MPAVFDVDAPATTTDRSSPRRRVPSCLPRRPLV